MEKRIEWDDLPAPLKDSISARTGPVLSGRAATDGQNSPLTAILDTRDGKVFVKWFCSCDVGSGPNFVNRPAPPMAAYIRDDLTTV